MSKLRIAAETYKQGDYAGAIKLYEELAAEGLPAAQRFLAWMLLRGEGVSQDLREATDWFRCAASAGDLEAEFGLGRALALQGKFNQAYEWFLRSSEKGFMPSLYWVGVMKKRGLGTNLDPDGSLLCFRDAATRGHVHSLREYSKSLLNGCCGVLGRVKGATLYLLLIAKTFYWVFRDRTDYRCMI